MLRAELVNRTRRFAEVGSRSSLVKATRSGPDAGRARRTRPHRRLSGLLRRILDGTGTSGDSTTTMAQPLRLGDHSKHGRPSLDHQGQSEISKSNQTAASQLPQSQDFRLVTRFTGRAAGVIWAGRTAEARQQGPIAFRPPPAEGSCIRRASSVRMTQLPRRPPALSGEAGLGGFQWLNRLLPTIETGNSPARISAERGHRIMARPAVARSARPRISRRMS